MNRKLGLSLLVIVMVVGGVASLVWAVMHLRLYLILMCFGVGGLLLFQLFRKTTAPQPSFETVDGLSEFESGPGAMWMLLNYHGVNVSLEQLRLLTDVSRDVSVTGDDLQCAANHLRVVLK